MAEPNYGSNPPSPTGKTPPYPTNTPAYPKDSPYNPSNRPDYGNAAGGDPATTGLGKDVHHIEDSIEVDVPVTTCYDQWTQFEEFPKFMDGIEQVEQVDDTHLHWVAQIAGIRKEWDAEILEQVPDDLVSWRSTSGDINNGTVEFLPTDKGCRIRLIMTYGVSGFTEKLGEALGFLKAKVHGDLKRFKKFIEARQVETGAWRGEVHGGRTTREPRSRTHRTDRGIKDLGDAGTGLGSQFDKPF
jgi:uncharacterized membrane protein